MAPCWRPRCSAQPFPRAPSLLRSARPPATLSRSGERSKDCPPEPWRASCSGLPAPATKRRSRPATPHLDSSGRAASWTARTAARWGFSCSAPQPTSQPASSSAHPVMPPAKPGSRQPRSRCPSSQSAFRGPGCHELVVVNERGSPIADAWIDVWIRDPVASSRPQPWSVPSIWQPPPLRGRVRPERCNRTALGGRSQRRRRGDRTHQDDRDPPLLQPGLGSYDDRAQPREATSVDCRPRRTGFPSPERRSTEVAAVQPQL